MTALSRQSPPESAFAGSHHKRVHESRQRSHRPDQGSVRRHAPHRIDGRHPFGSGQRPSALAAQIALRLEPDELGCFDLFDLDGEAQRPSDRSADQQAGSAAGGHGDIDCFVVSDPDPFGSGQSRPPFRPLIDPFENRPHRLDSGVDDPPFVEMERCGFSGQRGDMIVGHGSTVV